MLLTVMTNSLLFRSRVSGVGEVLRFGGVNRWTDEIATPNLEKSFATDQRDQVHWLWEIMLVEIRKNPAGISNMGVSNKNRGTPNHPF